jgi:hypothetical protein
MSCEACAAKDAELQRLRERRCILMAKCELLRWTLDKVAANSLDAQSVKLAMLALERVNWSAIDDNSDRPTCADPD